MIVTAVRTVPTATTERVGYQIKSTAPNTTSDRNLSYSPRQPPTGARGAGRRGVNESTLTYRPPVFLSSYGAASAQKQNKMSGEVSRGRCCFPTAAICRLLFLRPPPLYQPQRYLFFSVFVFPPPFSLLLFLLSILSPMCGTVLYFCQADNLCSTSLPWKEKKKGIHVRSVRTPNWVIEGSTGFTR